MNAKSSSSTLKELTPIEMAAIIHASISELATIADTVTAWAPFDSLPKYVKELHVLQVTAIIDNQRVRPNELHQIFKVTGQKWIAAGTVEDNNIARLKTYMIPFNELPLIVKTNYRLQVQLTRTLIRHNRNVKRSEKWQRKRQTLSGRGVEES
jgi:hypothetical protein